MADYAHPQALVDTAWLAEHAKDASVRVFEVDVTTTSYDEGHVEGHGLTVNSTGVARRLALGLVLYSDGPRAFLNVNALDRKPADAVEHERLADLAGRTVELDVAPRVRHGQPDVFSTP